MAVSRILLSESVQRAQSRAQEQHAAAAAELTGQAKKLSDALQKAEEAGKCASRELDACQKALTSNNYELEQLKENLRNAQMEAADARVC
jgi:Zn-dependent protease with chaperone function